MFGVSGSYISLIGSDRQWIKASTGFCPPGDSRGESFGNHAIQRASVVVIEDTVRDPRFMHNTMVTGPSNIRLYAGVPLLTTDGYAIGALCITDNQPRTLDAAQLTRL